MLLHRSPRALACAAALVSLPLVNACGPGSDGETGTSSSDTGTTAGETTADTPTAGETTADTPTAGEATTSESTGPGTTCSEPHSVTDDCCCFELVVEDEGATSFLKNTCPTGTDNCAAIEGTCTGSFGNDGSCSDDDIALDATAGAAIACVLDALRAGAPGAVQWSIVAVPGFAGHSTVVHITGVPDLLQTSQGYVDSDKSIGEIGRFDLPPATFFDDCQAMATPLDQFKCLKSFLGAAPLSTCSLE